MLKIKKMTLGLMSRNSEWNIVQSQNFDAAKCCTTGWSHHFLHYLAFAGILFGCLPFHCTQLARPFKWQNQVSTRLPGMQSQHHISDSSWLMMSLCSGHGKIWNCIAFILLQYALSFLLFTLASCHMMLISKYRRSPPLRVMRVDNLFNTHAHFLRFFFFHEANFSSYTGTLMVLFSRDLIQSETPNNKIHTLPARDKWSLCCCFLSRISRGLKCGCQLLISLPWENNVFLRTV